MQREREKKRDRLLGITFLILSPYIINTFNKSKVLMNLTGK